MPRKPKRDNVWTLDPSQPNLEVTHTQNKKGRLRYMKYKDKNKFLGFVVFGGGFGRHGGAPVVRPIYEATLHLQPAGGKDADTRYVFQTHDVGPRLSGFSYAEDPEGVLLASIASMALGFLQRRTEVSQDAATAERLAVKLGIKLPVKKKKPRVARR